MLNFILTDIELTTNKSVYVWQVRKDYVHIYIFTSNTFHFSTGLCFPRETLDKESNGTEEI